MTNQAALFERSKEESLINKRSRERFLMLKTRFIKNLYCLSKRELNIYLYLMANINRDTGYHVMANGPVKSSKKVWANLDEYYRKNMLCTARTQMRIEKDTGVKQSNISIILKRLEERKLIQIVGEETVEISKFSQQIPIYLLGHRVEALGEINDIFFYELKFEDR